MGSRFKIKSRADAEPRRPGGLPASALLRSLAPQQQGEEDSGISSDDDDTPQQEAPRPAGSAASPHTPAGARGDAAAVHQQQQPAPASSSMSAQRSFLSSVSTPAAMARPQASRLSSQGSRYAEGSLQALLGRPQQQAVTSPKALTAQRSLRVVEARHQCGLHLVDCCAPDCEVETGTSCTVLIRTQLVKDLELSPGSVLSIGAGCEELDVGGHQVLMPLWVCANVPAGQTAGAV